MKKLLTFFGTLLVLIAVLWTARTALEAQHNQTSSSESPSAREPLYLFNWGNYVDPDLIAQFEAETNYTVIYETYDSTDAMEAKLLQGGTRYDLIFPSESIVPRLLERQLLLPLDHQRIQGLEHIAPFLLNHAFDPQNRYTVPYFWGTVGIMVNSSQIDPTTITKWADLWRPEYRNSILLLDGNRETLGIALQALGFSLNSKNPDELAHAQAHLQQLAPNTRAILMEEIKVLMTSGEAPIGIGYSGDAASVIAENPDIVYIIPEDNSAVWTDNFAIPYTVKNIDGAYAFINFMLQPEHATQNAEYVGYTTPNESAKALLPEEWTADPAFYPDESILQSLEHYEYLGKEWTEVYHDLFLEFKMGL